MRRHRPLKTSRGKNTKKGRLGETGSYAGLKGCQKRRNESNSTPTTNRAGATHRKKKKEKKTKKTEEEKELGKKTGQKNTCSGKASQISKTPSKKRGEQ